MTSTYKIVIYNIIKLRVIGEFKLNDKIYSTYSFDSFVELLNKYDSISLKSWFSIDIKLGVPTITFNQDTFFLNTMNFDWDFLENILERTGNLTKLNVNLSDIKFSNEYTTSPSYSSTSKSQIEKTPSSYSSKSSKKIVNVNPNSVGAFMTKLILYNYNICIINRFSQFFESNFYDTKDYLKKEMLRNENECKASITPIINERGNYYLYVLTDSNITVGPYLKDLTNRFRRPSYIRDVVKLVFSI